MRTEIALGAGADTPGVLPAGATLRLAAGVHGGGLYVEHDLTVIGEEGAVLDAGGRGPALHVASDGIVVTVKGVTLRGGRNEAGGGVFVEGRAEVTLEGCAIEGNKAESIAPGVAVLRGRLSLMGCRVGPRDGVLVTNVGALHLQDSEVEGDVAVREGANLVVYGGAVRGRLSVRGTTTRHPNVLLDGAAVGELINDPMLPGDVVTF